jgi:hypothetical protein
MCPVLVSVAPNRGEATMTDSQKWSIWILVVVVGLLVAACVGGPWLFIAVWVVGRIAILVCLAGALSAVRTRR